MNEEIKNVFLRLEEIASAIRGSVDGAAEPCEACLEHGQVASKPGCDRRSGERFGTYHSNRKADAASQYLEMVEAMISIRSLRDRYFECDLFFDPAWSMLIDLYRAELKGRRLSVTSVCIASGVAGTTALRYVRELEDREYVSRVPDPHDRRRAFIQLTRKARKKLDDYFERVNAQCRAA